MCPSAWNCFTTTCVCTIGFDVICAAGVSWFDSPIPLTNWSVLFVRFSVIDAEGEWSCWRILVIYLKHWYLIIARPFIFATMPGSLNSRSICVTVQHMFLVQMNQSFVAFDQDRSGQLSRQEMLQALTHAGMFFVVPSFSWPVTICKAHCWFHPCCYAQCLLFGASKVFRFHWSDIIGVLCWLCNTPTLVLGVCHRRTTDAQHDY